MSSIVFGPPFSVLSCSPHLTALGNPLSMHNHTHPIPVSSTIFAYSYFSVHWLPSPTYNITFAHPLQNKPNSLAPPLLPVSSTAFGIWLYLLMLQLQENVLSIKFTNINHNINIWWLFRPWSCHPYWPKNPKRTSIYQTYQLPSQVAYFVLFMFRNMQCWSGCNNSRF